MKKSLSVILSILMILSSFSIITTVSAKETNVVLTGDIYSDKTGDCTWSFDEDTCTFTISGQGQMESYKDAWNIPWKDYLSLIKTVKIEDGVTNIGNYSFENCGNLEKLIIADSVTIIGDYAFNKCKNLTQVILSNSLTEIGRSAFKGCTSLTSIAIPNSVTNIVTGAFSGCSSLVDINMSENLTHIGQSIISATGYWNDKNNWDNDVLYLDNYLIKAKDLTGDYTIKDGTKLLSDGAFYECKDLNKVTIPNSMSKISSFAFDYCEGLTSVVLPDSITLIGGSAFGNCYNLKSITLPKSLKTLEVNCFDNCKSLTEVTIPEGVTYIGSDAFMYCTNLKDISLPSGITRIGQNAFYHTAYYNDENNWDNGVMYIGNYLLETRESVTGSYSIKDGTELIADYAFLARKITEINIPDSVNVIGGFVFSLCTELTKVTIPNSVTKIYECAFASSYRIQSIVLPENLDTISWSMFDLCGGLTNITIPDKVEFIDGYAFKDCNSLKSITIPSSVTHIDCCAFENCNDLKDIYFTGTESQWKSIKFDNTDDASDSFLNANVHYSVNTFKVSSMLENVVTNNVENKVAECNTYASVLTPVEGYKIDSVKVKMGDNDFTVPFTESECAINIPEVNGDISIIAVATSIHKQELENLLKQYSGDFDYTPEYWYNIYTKDSYDNYLNAKKKAETLLADENTTDAEFKDMIDEFSNARNNLVKVSETSTTEPTTVTTEPTTSTTLPTTVSTTVTTESTTVTTVPTTTKPTVKKVTKVSLSKKSVTLLNGRSATVKVKVSPTNATNKKLKWTTSNSKIATVNQSGKITAKGRGYATIKVMALDGSNKYATIKVTVKQSVTSVKLSRNSAILKVKGKAKQKTVTLKATAYPKNANVKSVKWTTSKSKIATVNSKGKVTAKKKGTCFIYATAKDGSKKSAKCKITVK